MKPDILPWIKTLGPVLVGFYLAYMIFGGKAPQVLIIPRIITRYDTVEVTPKWLADSEKAWKKRKATTDTVNLVITNTVIVEKPINVGPDTTQRPDLYPILEYHGGVRFGDTATVVTFSLRSGNRTVSRIFVPGILSDMTADSVNVPKLTYQSFPAPKRPSLLYRLKYILAGAALYSVIK